MTDDLVIPCNKMDPAPGSIIYIPEWKIAMQDCDVFERLPAIDERTILRQIFVRSSPTHGLGYDVAEFYETGGAKIPLGQRIGYKREDIEDLYQALDLYDAIVHGHRFSSKRRQHLEDLRRKHRLPVPGRISPSINFSRTDLGFREVVKANLAAAGIRDIGTLASYTEKELLDLPGIARRTVSHIKEVLAEHDYSLKPE